MSYWVCIIPISDIIRGMSSSESDLEDISCTPPAISKLAASATENLLPNKLKDKYDAGTNVLWIGNWHKKHYLFLKILS